MMSTPAATSVESVREKRAIVIFSTVSPMRIGSFSLKRVPVLAAALRLLPAEERPDAERDEQDEVRLAAQQVRRRRRRTRVSVGSWPFSDAKIFTKIGTRNISIPISTSVAKIRTIVG